MIPNALILSNFQFFYFRKQIILKKVKVLLKFVDFKGERKKFSKT